MLTNNLLTVESFTWLLAISFLVMLIITIYDLSIEIEKMGDTE